MSMSKKYTSSVISGISLLSIPADIYTFGTMYIWNIFGVILVCILHIKITLPLFFELQLISVHEYLSLRFNKKIRTFTSLLFAIYIFLYNPIVMYISALAFSQATGTRVHLITPIVCIVCIAYTGIGGLRAVVWTDTLQSLSIGVCIIVVIIRGAITSGGFSDIWDTSVKGKRVELLNVDLTDRNSFWGLAIANIAHGIAEMCINQETIQRYLSVPTFQDAKMVAWNFCIGSSLIKVCCVVIGLAIFTNYADCDPLKSRKITHNDQILPHYVMSIGENVYGLSGIFIAGIFNASLSTLSTTLNAVSGTILEDLVSPFISAETKKKHGHFILKLIVVIYGVLCTGCVFVVEKLGRILPLALGLAAITEGPLVGIFLLGMVFPSANEKGALWGGVAGLLFSSWLVMGHQWYKMKGLIVDVPKPTLVNGCDSPANFTIIDQDFPEPEYVPFVMYRISFWYFTLLSVIVVVIVGLVISRFTKQKDKLVDPKFISPAFRFLMSHKELQNSHFQNNFQVDDTFVLTPLNE